MPKPGEHKTVQKRILEYAQEIGWTVLSQSEAEELRGFDRSLPPKEAAKAASVFFDDEMFACLLYTSPSPRDATLSRMPSSA